MHKYKLVLASLLLLLGLSQPLQVVLSAPVLPPLNSTNTGKQLTGKFIWFELATIDVDKQKEFYGNVFGWQFRAMSDTDDQYTLIMNGDHPVAGLFTVKPREGVNLGALWLGMISVNDPVQAVAAVKAAGGSVHTEPTALAQRGTYALLRDSEGALFGVLKSDSGDPPDHEIAIGEFFWMDLFAKDMQRAATFYKQFAGYEIVDDTKGVQRKFLRVGDKYRAGIVPRPEEANRSGWLPYIKVKDIAATLKKVEAAGGYIMVEPDKSLLDGNLAIFADPQGGIIGIVKWVQP